MENDDQIIVFDRFTIYHDSCIGIVFVFLHYMNFIIHHLKTIYLMEDDNQIID